MDEENKDVMGEEAEMPATDMPVEEAEEAEMPAEAVEETGEEAA